MSDAALGARSWLYVPGDRPERFAKAVASGADAVILDLEDAVAVAAKDEARAAVVDAVGAPADGVERWVRVNQGERGIADLHALAAVGDGVALTGVVLPKATAASVATTVEHGRLGGRPVVALVESAAAVLELGELAGRPEVLALAMGEVDLAADLGVEAAVDGAELWPVRLSVVVASAARGLRPPVGPVWLAVRDLDGLATATAELRRRGFGGRQVVHPDHVAVVNAAFTPTAEEVERAAAVLEGATGSAPGAWVGPDGKMVDEAVLRGARRTLARAARWST